MKEVIVYSKDYCPYCDRAKALLKRKGIPFKAIELENDPEGFEVLKAKTGWLTVPQIFIGDRMIGGYTDLAALEKSGELDRLVAQLGSR